MTSQKLAKWQSLVENIVEQYRPTYPELNHRYLDACCGEIKHAITADIMAYESVDVTLTIDPEATTALVVLTFTLDDITSTVTLNPISLKGVLRENPTLT